VGKHLKVKLLHRDTIRDGVVCYLSVQAFTIATGTGLGLFAQPAPLIEAPRLSIDAPHYNQRHHLPFGGVDYDETGMVTMINSLVASSTLATR
jgi:hypothetical protein